MKKKYALKFSIIFALSLFSSAFNIIVLAYINKFILTLNNANFRVIALFCLILVLFFISTYIVRYIVATINNVMIYELRVRFIHRILHSKMIFDEIKPKILASLSKDINNISNGFMRLSDALQGFILLFLSFFYFLFLSINLGIFVIFWFVAIGAISLFFINKTRKNYILSRKFDDELYRNFTELLGGFKELRIDTNRSDYFLAHFISNANLQKNANISAEIYGGLTSNILSVMMLGGIGIVIYLALALSFAPFADAMTICLSMMFLRAPFMMMISSVPSILQGFISLRKVRELNLKPFDEINFSAPKSPLKWQKIELKNVCFAYNNELILNDINLQINKGESVFLIGKNGSGKSTLFLIMCALLEPKSGEILLDGASLNEKNKISFQNSVGVLFSDFYLFKQITNSDKNELNFWIENLKLKGKINFEISDKKAVFDSLNLSMGQKKRLALLQILSLKKDFLMLDEFGADQDPEFRAHFYNKILPLLKRKGITLFAISHDDKYFDKADKIYKITDGRLSVFHI